MKTAVFAFISLLIGLVIAELTIKVAAIVSPRIAYELRPPWSNRALDPDPKLGYRVSRYYPGSDKRGYRNPEALDTSNILAIGDSTTYGYSVVESQSWPAVVRNENNLDIYNAGVGGYGPCEYLEVSNELIQLNPTQVVVALYLGNDMSDAYTSVYLEDRCPDLQTDNAELLKELRRLREEQSLLKQATELGLESVAEPFRDGLPLSHLYGSNLRDKSSIYSLVRAAYHKLNNIHYGRFGEDTDKRFATESQIQGAIAYEHIKELRTVFKSPAVEVLAVDQTDLRISEGRRITETVLDEINTLAQANNAQLIVAIIPTKGVAYRNILGDSFISQHSSFPPKIENELKLKQDILSFLDENEIVHVDTTPLLEKALSDRTPPFHQTSNEHPNAHGYSVVANAIAAAVSK